MPPPSSCSPVGAIRVERRQHPDRLGGVVSPCDGSGWVCEVHRHKPMNHAGRTARTAVEQVLRVKSRVVHSARIPPMPKSPRWIWTSKTDALHDCRWPAVECRVLFLDSIAERGRDLFRAACERDLEGIAAKWGPGTYCTDGRATSWLKIKNLEYSQIVDRYELFATRRTFEGGRAGLPAWISSHGNPSQR